MTKEEAIKRIEDWNLGADKMEVLSTLIPELAEDKDDRMRKKLIEYLKERSHSSGSNQEVKICNDGIAWLENREFKKIEPKPDYEGMVEKFKTAVDNKIEEELVEQLGIEDEEQKLIWNAEKWFKSIKKRIKGKK